MMLDKGMSMTEMAENIKRNFDAAMAAIADNAREAFYGGVGGSMNSNQVWESLWKESERKSKQVLSFAEHLQDAAAATFGVVVTRSEAVAIARGLLLRAECERLEVDDAEAQHGIQYNEDGGLFV